MARYRVAVTDGSSLAWYARRRLKSYGLKYRDGAFRGKAGRGKIQKLKNFCRDSHLKFYIDNEYGKRSTNYRQTFFESMSPVFGNRYFCSYCGRPVGSRNTTVDHLFPVARVSTSPSLQHLMRFLGIKSLNCKQNLVPACRKCNRKKGTKMGIWILRGYIGRIQWLWYFRWSIRIVFAAMTVYLVIKIFS